MTIASYLFITIILGTIKAYADWGYPEKDHSVILTSKTFQRFVEEFRNVLIVFQTPNCKHCVEFGPVLERISIGLKNAKTRMPVAIFDCSKESSFCENQVIPSYPFLRFAYKGRFVDYLNEKKYKPIMKFIKNLVSYKPGVLKDRALEGFIYYRGNSKIINDDFYFVSKLFHSESPFYITQNNSLIQRSRMEQNTIIYLAKNDSSPLVYRPRDVHTFKQLKQFVMNQIYRVTEVDDSFERRLFKDGIHALILFVPTKEPLEATLQTFSKAVAPMIGNLECVYVPLPSTRVAGKRITDIIGPPIETSSIIYVDPLNEYVLRKFLFTGEVHSDNLELFLINVWDGVHEQYLKSELPELRRTGKFNKIVSVEFKKLIRNRGKDTVVFVHTDGCQECPKIMGVVREISEEYSKDPRIQFYHLDGSRNEIADFACDQGPQIIAYTRFESEGVHVFSGKFIKEEIQYFIDRFRVDDSFSETSDL